MSERAVLPLSSPPASAGHTGNFGAMRLVLALAVIVGHTPELLDGDRHREPLTALFHGISLGEAAVLGFFLLSGYLLTTSILVTPDLPSYATKRIARIYPGFLAASLVCLLVIAPLAGGTLGPGYLRDMLLLLPPYTQGAFAGAPYPVLNGALWTIHHEACCYIGLATLSACGLLRRRRIILALTIAAFALVFLSGRLDPALGAGHGDLLYFPHFLSAFLAGVCARLLLKPARQSGLSILLAAALLAVVLSLQILPEQAVILLGGYILFWFCERRDTPLLGQIGRRIDLSYGIYLYAWPIQNLLIWRYGFDNLAMISLTTIAIAGAAAVLSWYLVERPAMRVALALIGSRAHRRQTSLAVKNAGAP